MGYTHYWSAKRSSKPTQFAKLAASATKLVDNAGIPIGNWGGNLGSKPEITDEIIALNGVGEDSHESFNLYSGAGPFTFCKTARKPYDSIVTGILCLAEFHCPGWISIESDGYAADWIDGLALAREIEPKASLPATIEGAA